MKLVLTSLAVAFFTTIATGQQIKLTGRLISVDGKPVPNIRVGIGDEQSKPSDKNGRFSIHLPSNSRPGERVVITVNNTFWLINEPLDGEWTIPAPDPKNPPTLDLIIAAWSSKGLWTGARIEKELKLQQNAEELIKKYGSTADVLDDVFQQWATSQNNRGNTLKEQSTRVEGREAVRLLGEAESAYRRALLVFTRESKPQEWATTQHNLGFVLQEQGVRANGPEAIRLIGEGVAAYRQALSVRTREQLPLEWAITQNDLGNALQGQGARAEGPEARRLLAEAATAYAQALLVFTREFMPQQWAMTQHNLGSARHEQGTRTAGPDGLKLLAEAVAAYRQALLVRTREQQPRGWAITQNNLGNALQAQATRADRPEATRLLDEAVTAYRQSLLVFTREQLPNLWAMTKHNVGSALQEQGARTVDPEARRLFGEAVTAYHEALGIWTREQRPQQWAMAQTNLARAYFNLKEWDGAAECYQNLLADERLDAKFKIPVRALEIATLIALNRSADVTVKMKNLIEAVQGQTADLRVQWTFAGIQQSISQNQQFGAKRAWLLQLFAALEGENRDAIIKRLTAAAESFGN